MVFFPDLCWDTVLRLKESLHLSWSNIIAKYWEMAKRCACSSSPGSHCLHTVLGGPDVARFPKKGSLSTEGPLDKQRPKVRNESSSS